MEFNFIFASNVNEVSQSLFDYFSISHLRMGIGFYLALALISTLLKIKKNKSNVNWTIPNWHWWLYLIIVVIFGILWELLENTLLIPFKFNSTADSLQNAITDVILVGGAALGILFLGKKIYGINIPANLQFVWYYFYSFLPYIGLEFVFYLCEMLTLGL